MDWQLLSERRMAYGVTEVARCLDVPPSRVRQWLFRAKRHIFWGYPSGFPQPDETVGGRPIWVGRRMIRWLAFRIYEELWLLPEDEMMLDKSEEARQNTALDDPRHLAEGVLAHTSPILGGEQALKHALQQNLPPLLVAVALTAAEAGMQGKSERMWKRRVLAAEEREPSIGTPLRLMIRELRQIPELWPW